MSARPATLALLVLAACDGGAGARPDAGGHDAALDAAAACTARFRGNFTETATAATCATLAAGGSGDALLELAIPSATLAPDVPATFDLGPAPSAGAYSSESVASWSVRAVQTVGTGACVYSAGATAVPPGNFTLTLQSIDPAAHGALALTLWVLAYPGTECGTGDTEEVDVQF